MGDIGLPFDVGGYCGECSRSPRSRDLHSAAHADSDVPEVNAWRCTCGSVNSLANTSCLCGRSQAGHSRGIWCRRCKGNMCYIEDWHTHQAHHDAQEIIVPPEECQPILMCPKCGITHIWSAVSCRRCEYPLTARNLRYSCHKCGWNVRPANWEGHLRVCPGRQAPKYHEWHLTIVDEAKAKKVEAARARKARADERKALAAQPWDAHILRFIETGDPKALAMALKKQLPNDHLQQEIIWGRTHENCTCSRCTGERANAVARKRPAPAVARSRSARLIPISMLAASLVLSAGGHTVPAGVLLILFFVLGVLKR